MSELIDREALKDAVKRYAGEPIKKKDRKCQAICLDMLGTIDAQPTASPWHRCEDELPPAHENLLCCGSRGGMFVGWVLGSAVCICGSCTGFVHGGKGRQFTHWMPLPEPPKEDA